MPVATERGKSKRTGSDPRKRKMVSARIFFKAVSTSYVNKSFGSHRLKDSAPWGEGRAWRETRENHPPRKLAQECCCGDYLLLWAPPVPALSEIFRQSSPIFDSFPIV